MILFVNDGIAFQGSDCTAGEIYIMDLLVNGKKYEVINYIDKIYNSLLYKKEKPVPIPSDILAGKDTVINFINMEQPKVIIFCGKYLKKYYKEVKNSIEIMSLSDLLITGANKSRYFPKTKIQIEKAIHDYNA